MKFAGESAGETICRISGIPRDRIAIVKEDAHGDISPLGEENPSFPRSELCRARHLSRRMLRSNNWNMEALYSTAGYPLPPSIQTRHSPAVSLNTAKR